MTEHESPRTAPGINRCARRRRTAAIIVTATAIVVASMAVSAEVLAVTNDSGSTGTATHSRGVLIPEGYGALTPPAEGTQLLPLDALRELGLAAR